MKKRIKRINWYRIDPSHNSRLVIMVNLHHWPTFTLTDLDGRYIEIGTALEAK